MVKPSALILNSGGMDCSTLAYYVKYQLGYTIIHSIAFDYGQRHRKELDAAKRIAQHLGVQSHTVIKVDLEQFGGSPLTDPALSVPKKSDDQQIITVVPARNSIFLSMATAHAEKIGARDIFFGPNLDDFRSYLDCRPIFVQAMSFALSVGNNIDGVFAPFIELTKTEIIAIGKKLNVPYELTWSCYEGKDAPCMRCDACVERMESFFNNDIPDPLVTPDAWNEFVKSRYEKEGK